ncbi:hypothetical protein BDD39_000390 [Saccharococcus thermophilus]|uniref:Uncharacterized protein n=2 Tax=Saccharococcus thermophilus TaxID=29396 RepID=A0A846MCS7_9BACL|nr:hypothetical protein [Saccharococcus thermophilus]NIK13880.1 hypothetical protein [Saccharococcus thermophilus]
MEEMMTNGFCLDISIGIVYNEYGIIFGSYFLGGTITIMEETISLRELFARTPTCP